MKIHKPDTCLLLQNYHVLAKQPMLLISLGFVVNSDGSLLDEQKAWPWLLEQFKNHFAICSHPHKKTSQIN